MTGSIPWLGAEVVAQHGAGFRRQNAADDLYPMIVAIRPEQVEQLPAAPVLQSVAANTTRAMRACTIVIAHIAHTAHTAHIAHGSSVT